MPQQLRTPLGRVFPWPLTRAVVIEGQQCYPGVRPEAVLSLGCTIEDVPEPPPPTLAEVKAARLAEVRSAAQTYILTAYPDWLQRNAALGLEDTALTEAMGTGITAVRVESDRCENAIDAASDAAGVASVVPAWPAIGG